MTLTVEAWAVNPGDILVEFTDRPRVDQLLWDGQCEFWLYARNGRIVARCPEGARVVVERHTPRLIPDSALLDACDPHGIPRPLHLVENHDR